jgi:hypothetical protein
MSWRFGATREYASIKTLVVHAIPAEGSVELVCEGPECVLDHQRLAPVGDHMRCDKRKCVFGPMKHGLKALDLSPLFAHRHLRVGSRILVSIVKPGSIGKEFEFAVRVSRPPRVTITCLAPGAHRAKAC